MVAASKMRKAQESATSTRAYAAAGESIVGTVVKYLAKIQDGFTHPLVETRATKHHTLVTISSDKGLAGGYNANVLKQTLSFLEEHEQEKISIVTVGEKIQDGLKRLGREIEYSFSDLPTYLSSSDTLPISKLTTRAFISRETDKVSIIYTKFHSTLRQTTEVKQLLPIVLGQTDKEEGSVVSYLFEPSVATVLKYVLPRVVEIQLLQTLLESAASEHSARMLAMKNATDNASELIEDLKLTYNTVRQTNITKEISEIVGGSIE